MTHYEQWQKTHKINLRVYTDEQMFELGYNWRDEEVEQLMTKIEKMEKEIKKLKVKAKNANS
jgi:SMC interacting uncharacterized protein involved in chromosome segregation